MSKREEAIKRTGEMLLQGWKMLGIACPVCTSVIMSKGETMRCPGCNMPVISEEQSSEFYSSDPVEEKPVAVMPPSQVKEQIREPESFEELKREFDRTRESRDAVSSKLGEKMLLGWIMLGAVCPNNSCRGTPLMRETADTPEMYCVSCSEKFVENRYGEIDEVGALPIVKEAKRVEIEKIHNDNGNLQTKLFSDAPILSFTAETSDDVTSRLISNKLLQGWGLLDKICPVCAAPLMRDKEKKEVCVKCSSPSKMPQLTAPVKEPEIDSKKLIQNNFRELDTDSDDDLETAADALAYQEYLKSRVGTSSSKKAEPVNITSNNVKNEVSAKRVCSILKKKMLSVALSLQDNDDIASSIQQAQLIKELATAHAAAASI